MSLGHNENLLPFNTDNAYVNKVSDCREILSNQVAYVCQKYKKNIDTTYPNTNKNRSFCSLHTMSQ